MQAIINLVGESPIKSGRDYAYQYISDPKVRTEALATAKKWLENKTGSEETEILCNAVWNKLTYTSSAKTDLSKSDQVLNDLKIILSGKKIDNCKEKLDVAKARKCAADWTD